MAFGGSRPSWGPRPRGAGVVGFGSRVGGVSEAPYDSLNIGVLTDDADAAVVENRRRLAAAVGVDPHDVPIGLQVHKADLAVHAGPQEPSPFAEPGTALEEVDGHVVRQPGPGAARPHRRLPAGRARRARAGWRCSTAAGAGSRPGSSPAAPRPVEATSAAIGPGIGPCCYEVGPEVLEAFADLGEGIADGRMLDLPEVARRLLARAGVEQVESAGLCTFCEPELFFSHRRDQGVTGRMGNLAWIEA